MRMEKSNLANNTNTMAVQRSCADEWNREMKSILTRFFFSSSSSILDLDCRRCAIKSTNLFLSLSTKSDKQKNKKKHWAPAGISKFGTRREHTDRESESTLCHQWNVYFMIIFVSLVHNVASTRMETFPNEHQTILIISFFFAFLLIWGETTNTKQRKFIHKFCLFFFLNKIFCDSRFRFDDYFVISVIHLIWFDVGIRRFIDIFIVSNFGMETRRF